MIFNELFLNERGISGSHNAQYACVELYTEVYPKAPTCAKTTTKQESSEILGDQFIKKDQATSQVGN